MGTQKRSRLVVRILIAITLTVVVMNVLQTAIVTNRIDNIVSGNYEEECDELTRSYTDLISSKISEYMSLLTVYTSADIVKTGDPAQIVPWLKSHADIRNKAFDYVAFVDLEGNFDSDIDTHTTVVDRSYYQDIVKKGMETTMDNPVTSKVSGQTIVHICRAAKANGETIGFFTGIVSLDTLKSIIEHIKIGSTGFATLYSGDSQLIATSGDEETVKADFEFSKGNAEYAAKMTSSVASGKPGSSWAPNSRGSQSYLSFASIDGTPGWTFLFCVDKVQVQAASRSVSKWNVGVGIVYGILLLVVMAVMVVSALKPLEVVQSTINGIASGNADLPHRLADVLDFSVLQQMPRLDHFLIVFRQDTLVNDQVIIKHRYPSFCQHHKPSVLKRQVCFYTSVFLYRLLRSRLYSREKYVSILISVELYALYFLL